MSGFDSPMGRGNDYLVPSTLLAANVDRWVWRAPRKCKLVGVVEKHSVVGGASAAVRPRKITASATAPGATAGATVIEQTSAAIDLTATVNVEQEPTVVTADGANVFQEGDWLAEDYSGTLTGLVGQVSYRFLAL